jgi:hypothetical protein
VVIVRVRDAVLAGVVALDVVEARAFDDADPAPVSRSDRLFCVTLFSEIEFCDDW